MGNYISVTGIATGEFKMNHQFKGQDDKMIIAVETEIISTSANHVGNVIKVIILKDTLFEQRLKNKGAIVKVEGFIQNFQKNAYGKRISEVFVKPTHVYPATAETKHKNAVELTGKVCGVVTFKKRQRGRLVAELKVKIKRKNGGLDYIPVVAFDENAQILEDAVEGVTVVIKGRIHSRSYRYKYEENAVPKEAERTVMEVCAHNLTLELNEGVEKAIEKASIYNHKITSDIAFKEDKHYTFIDFLGLTNIQKDKKNRKTREKAYIESKNRFVHPAFLSDNMEEFKKVINFRR